MKENQRKFLDNIVDFAFDTYSETLYEAVNSDFYRNNLGKFAYQVNMTVSHTKNPKKKFQLIVYAASLVYNNEIIANPDLCYTLNLLSAMTRFKLYKPHKFIQFIGNGTHLIYLVPGMDYTKVEKIIQKLLGGIKC